MRLPAVTFAKSCPEGEGGEDGGDGSGMDTCYLSEIREVNHAPAPRPALPIHLKLTDSTRGKFPIRPYEPKDSAQNADDTTPPDTPFSPYRHHPLPAPPRRLTTTSLRLLAMHTRKPSTRVPL